MNPIIAVNTMAFQGFDLSTALREISALGATHVELCFTRGYVDGLSEDYFKKSVAPRTFRNKDNYQGVYGNHRKGTKGELKAERNKLNGSSLLYFELLAFSFEL